MSADAPRSGLPHGGRLLIVNPRSGDDVPSVDELVRVAEAGGVRCHVLAHGEDPAAVAREAGASVLGVAGGDGSLAPVAAVALERDVPFVCVPFGTRTTSRATSGSTGTRLWRPSNPSTARSGGSTWAASTGGSS